MKSFIFCIVILHLMREPVLSGRHKTVEKRGHRRAWEAEDDDGGEGGPHYKPQFKETQRIISVKPGETAQLTCHVENLGTKMLTWKRTGIVHPLTIGPTTFVSDPRIRSERRRIILTSTTAFLLPTTTSPFFLSTTRFIKTTTHWLHMFDGREKSETMKSFHTTTKFPVQRRPFEPVLIPANPNADLYDDDYGDYLENDIMTSNVHHNNNNFNQQSASRKKGEKRMKRSHEGHAAIDEWVLSITDVRPSDQGVYQCQVNSKDDQSNFYDIFLKVNNIHVYGTQRVEFGMEVRLTCNATAAFAYDESLFPIQRSSSFSSSSSIMTSPTNQILAASVKSADILPGTLTWFKDERMVMSDPERGVTVIRNIEGTKSSSSILIVTRAHPSDSGVYECRGLPVKGGQTNKNTGNLVVDSKVYPKSVPSDHHHRQHNDESLLSHALLPDSASIYVHVSSSTDKGGTIAQKITSTSAENRFPSVTVISLLLSVHAMFELHGRRVAGCSC